MTAASHLPLALSPEKSLIPYWCVFGILAGALELNAVKGKMGPLQKLKHVIHFGVVLTLVLYMAMHLLAG